MFQIWFVYGLVLLLWFWYGFGYDFDMVSVMFFDVGQTCDLKPTHRNRIQKNIQKPVSKPYQNRIKAYQNRIKIISKSYQNCNKTLIEVITRNSKHIKFTSSNRIQNHIKNVKQSWIRIPGQQDLTPFDIGRFSFQNIQNPVGIKNF